MNILENWLLIKIWICTAVNVCNGTLSTPLMVVTKPRLSLVSSESLYQLTYLYRTYFWAFIHEICVSKESNIIKRYIGQQTKKLICLVLATCNLRNYSGEKFFLWILRFVGVWNICKNPRKYRNRVCFIFFPPQNYENKHHVTFWRINWYLLG